MKKQPLVSMLLGSALFGSALIATAQTADYERGRQLYENHCTSCHESQVHIREHAKVRSMTDLRYQIQRWRDELELSWTTEDVEDVQHYLKRRFYHLDTE